MSAQVFRSERAGNNAWLAAEHGAPRGSHGFVGNGAGSDGGALSPRRRWSPPVIVLANPLFRNESSRLVYVRFAVSVFSLLRRVWEGLGGLVHRLGFRMKSVYGF